jgi:hypothetical protein
MGFIREKPGIAVPYSRTFGIYKDSKGIHYYSAKKWHKRDILVGSASDGDEAFSTVQKLNKSKRALSSVG